MAKDSTLRSGELARRAGVSPDTLRYYERTGVLPRPLRGANGYRHYPAEALDRVLLVRRALAVGFSTEDLARILAVRDHGGAPCKHVREVAASKLEDLDQRLRDLNALRRSMRSMLREWDKRLASTRNGQRAALLETLTEVAPTRTAPLAPEPFNKKRIPRRKP